MRDRVASLSRAHRRVGRNRDPRPAGAAALRSQVERLARPRGSDRHRGRPARSAHAPARAAPHRRQAARAESSGPCAPCYLGDDDDEPSMEAVERRAGVWGEISRKVDSRPRVIWVGSVALVGGDGHGAPRPQGRWPGREGRVPHHDRVHRGIHGLAGPLRGRRDVPCAHHRRPRRGRCGCSRPSRRCPGSTRRTCSRPRSLKAPPPERGPRDPIVVDGKVEIDAVTAEAASTRATLNRSSPRFANAEAARPQMRSWAVKPQSRSIPA